MTTALKFQHREFNLEHARAGAPISLITGENVEILKWDRPGALSIVGIVQDKCFTVMAWNAIGTNANSRDLRLVMTPLGYIDGAPVFVGDQVVDKDTGKVTTVLSTWSRMNPDLWAWPAPAKVYPETKMDQTELANAALSKHSGMMVCTGAQLYGIANAALRHAIDAGQVVVPEPPAEQDPFNDDPAEVAFWNFDARKKGYSEWKGRPQSERDAFKAEYYRAVNADRAARDIAIAEAVAREMYNVLYSTPYRVSYADSKPDLAAIIAKVTA